MGEWLCEAAARRQHYIRPTCNYSHRACIT